MPASNRNLGLDALRILMSVMVIGLHTNWLCALSPLWNQLTVNGLFRAAVPIFFIINGYYLADAFQAGRVRLWLVRVLRIYLFWTIVYLPAYWPPSHSGATALVAFVANLVLGYWHLWYMAALAMGGAVLWLLRARSGQQLLWIAVGLFAFGMMLEIAKLDVGIPMPVRAYRSFLFDALPFLLIGYVARRDEVYLARSTIWTLAAVGLIALMFECFAQSRFAVSATAPDLHLSLLVLCPAVFLMALNLPFRTSSDRYAKASAAIYFSHLGFMLLGERIGLLPGLQLFAFVLLLSGLACWPLIAVSRRFRLTFVV